MSMVSSDLSLHECYLSAKALCRKGFCLFLAGAIMAVSSIPLLPIGTNAQAASYRPLCHMNSYMDSHAKMASMDHTQHAMTSAMRHCRIECCGHHDVGGLPHLLAPHAVSLTGFDTGLVVSDVTTPDLPVLKPRLWPSPVPPPRII